MNCPNKKRNDLMCNCSYPECPRHGVCCECLAYHRSKQELPACYFNKDAEKTYDRSFENYMKSRR